VKSGKGRVVKRKPNTTGKLCEWCSINPVPFEGSRFCSTTCVARGTGARRAKGTTGICACGRKSSGVVKDRGNYRCNRCKGIFRRDAPNESDRLVTLTRFERMAKIGRKKLARLISDGGDLHASMVDGKLDTEHPATKVFLERTRKRPLAGRKIVVCAGCLKEKAVWRYQSDSQFCSPRCAHDEKAKKYPVFGHMLTASELCAVSGVPAAAMRARLHRWRLSGQTASIEELILPPFKKSRSRPVLLRKGDVFLSAAEWAQRLGISHVTIQKRLRRGWSLEDALRA
jgi:hypothetical protein